jgi:hypothetical protein
MCTWWDNHPSRQQLYMPVLRCGLRRQLVPIRSGFALRHVGLSLILLTDARCQPCTNCKTDLAAALLTAGRLASTYYDPPFDAANFGDLLIANGLPSNDSSSDCSHQLALLDLPNLDPTQFPTLQQWATSALLWDIASSEVLNGTLQRAAVALPLSTLFIPDKATANPQRPLQAPSNGFLFDFGQRTIAPQRTRWRSIAPPAQRSRVTPEILAALDRVVSHAVAASQQRHVALQNYWDRVLQLSASDLSAFLERLETSEVVLPGTSSRLAHG